MKRINRVQLGIVALLFMLIISPQFTKGQQKKLVFGEQEELKALRARKSLVIDGKMDEKDWKRTEARSFENFYRIDKKTDRQSTTYRMLWDDQNLYVFFDCKDQYITAREKDRDGEPYFDDCAEVFLIPVPDSLNMHVGFEINLYKAANDFVFFNDFYNGEGCAFRSYNPEIEIELTVDGTINDNSDIDKGWTMEMAIPIELFKGVNHFCPVEIGSEWAFLAVRQDRNDLEGDRRSTSTIYPIYDMDKGVHQPNRFGILKFVK